MRKLRTALLAGAGALLVAGAAVAAEKYDHVMQVALPDGSVAHIRYAGNVQPRVIVADAPVRRVVCVDPVAVRQDAAFAEMDRIAAMMDAQQAAMMQHVAQMRAQMADALARAQSQTQTVAARQGAARAPQGMVSYSFVSTSSSNGGCTQTVQWSSDGTNAQPKVYKTSSGNCAAGEAKTAETPQKAAAPKTDAKIPGALTT